MFREPYNFPRATLSPFLGREYGNIVVSNSSSLKHTISSTQRSFPYWACIHQWDMAREFLAIDP